MCSLPCIDTCHGVVYDEACLHVSALHRDEHRNDRYPLPAEIWKRCDWSTDLIDLSFLMEVDSFLDNIIAVFLI